MLQKTDVLVLLGCSAATAAGPAAGLERGHPLGHILKLGILLLYFPVVVERFLRVVGPLIGLPELEQTGDLLRRRDPLAVERVLEPVDRLGIAAELGVT